VIDRCSENILCVAVSAGKTHDFALFKDSRLALAPSLELLADSGYQGVDKLHGNSQTPHKKSKHHPLTPAQKQHNHALASRRITVEHVLRILKRFRILSSTYRNRRKRFGLRLNLLAAIANLHN
jgi:IS5 family transposase